MKKLIVGSLLLLGCVSFANAKLELNKCYFNYKEVLASSSSKLIAEVNYAYSNGYPDTPIHSMTEGNLSEFYAMGSIISMPKGAKFCVLTHNTEVNATKIKMIENNNTFWIPSYLYDNEFIEID